MTSTNVIYNYNNPFYNNRIFIRVNLPHLSRGILHLDFPTE
jgi:hypothetical protein